jgi:hypothetical protein
MHVSFRTVKIAVAVGALTAALSGPGLSAGAATAASHRAAGRATSATAASPWSQTDYNAAQSRANLTEKTLTRTTVGKVRYLRGMAAPLNPPNPGGCQSSPTATPVLTGGSLYAMTNGQLSKYNPATGQLVWRHNPDPSFDTDYLSLAVADGLVVLGGLGCDSVSDPNGVIQAFKASTGARVWSEPTSADEGALWQMVVSGGYVAASGDSPGSGNVVSVRRLTTGAQVWFRDSNECDGRVVLVVAQVVLSHSCDLNNNETLVASKLSTGAKLWSLPGSWALLRGDTDAASGRHVYATNPAGQIVGLDPLTGKTQYTLAGATSVLAVDNTRAYADCGSLGVCAYNTTTGKQRWHSQPGVTPATAAEAGGVLYLDQGIALNTGTGQSITTLWAADLTARSLVVGDGRIAVITDPRVIDLFGLPGS